MPTAAEYRAEALRCRELASQLPSQKRELSKVLTELAQEYNRAARRVEEWEHTPTTMGGEVGVTICPAESRP